MVSLSAIRGQAAAVAQGRYMPHMPKCKAGSSLFALMSFHETAKTLFSKNDTSGNELNGLNWKDAADQLPIDLLKAVGWFGTIGALAGPFGGGAIGIGALIFFAGQLTGTKFSEKLSKILPDRTKLIAEACKAKETNQDSGLGVSITDSPQGILS